MRKAKLGVGKKSIVGPLLRDWVCTEQPSSEQNFLKIPFFGLKNKCTCYQNNHHNKFYGIFRDVNFPINIIIIANGEAIDIQCVAQFSRFFH